MKTLIFTCGDINGIGTEIIIKSINKLFNPQKRKIVFLCPANVFEKNASIANPKFPFKFLKRENLDSLSSSYVSIIDLCNAKLDFGRATKVSGKVSAEAIELSYHLAKENEFAAVITAPISKIAFELAGINFPGQTEYYANLSNVNRFMMLFLSRKLICGLATIHIEHKSVSEKLSKELLKEKVSILSESLEKDIRKTNARIAVLGLNPHAGEVGRIGKEEIEIIFPAIKEIKNRSITGPYVPDAFFGTKQYRDFDAVLGMYHDQVLIPFKMLNFERGVNFSAGLKIVRTSPDHGTAYDISGLGVAKPTSLIEAALWAEKIITNRSKNNAC
ncbi:MAG: 4-hydroxythreonine-4-phosphate dehydrogenase [Ignavibacteria bacterium]|nr:MAG: 4-hydroxythreonine-4-phosphate dehydrogenase [Ignavibacteria bacterium]KAF0159722.1 MAG: 4-hydroxythreonine-4-phosphate dehydrogenase [Ignavibacteria bacterium]